MSHRLRCLYVDARCLQDPNYQYRGVGYHISALLRARLRICQDRFRVIALVDAALGAIPTEFKDLLDEVSLCTNVRIGSDGCVFLDASPMTHSRRFGLRFRHHHAVLTTAVVYDFIPLDWPGCLQTVSSRIDYLSRLADLRKTSVFLPISEYSGRRLQEVLGIAPENIRVTGASVRQALVKAAASIPDAGIGAVPKPYFVTVVGGDRRKNAEVVVRAMRRLRLLLGRPVRVVVVGQLDQDYRNDLVRLAAEAAGLLEFRSTVTDEALAQLYRGAVATIAPSHIEGFSLPVAEAATCGSPVIASTCAAHLELLTQNEALFDSDNAPALTDRMATVLQCPEVRAALLRDQRALATRFQEDAVGKRFWSFLLDALERRFPGQGGTRVALASKPRIAVLTPFPPEESGVALCSERTLIAASKWFDIDLYTNARRPLAMRGCRDAGPISITPLLVGNYESVISVLGNSHFHTPIFDFFEEFGGPVILHDSRLTHIYYHRLGHEGFRRFASQLLGRPIDAGEIPAWLQDQNLPTLFVERILERGKPVIVHTTVYQRLLRQRYGAEVALANFPPNASFSSEELRPKSIDEARATLGFEDGWFVISSFGYVIPSKAPLVSLLAMDLLRSWNVPAHFYYVGKVDVGIENQLCAVSRELGLQDYVHFENDYVSDARYRQFLLASDASAQLRTFCLGQASGGLGDCAVAGLPTVATAELAESCDAPSYVIRIPDHASPLLLAEGLRKIWESRSPRDSAEWRDYCERHSFEAYAEQLYRILDSQ